MQEIAPRVYIETGYAGVTLGAVNWTHGLILIDSPFRQEDTRSWRSALLNLGGGVDRLLVNLDAHFDRTLGTRAMECTVVGHEKLAQVFRNRPISFKTQGNETGAEWEQFNGLGSIRWAPPEITFTSHLDLFWDTQPLRLEYHPGPAAGAIWAVLVAEKVIFIGDAVVIDQPPFLSHSDLAGWIEGLQILLAPEYSNHILVSGRGGLVAHETARQQLAFLNKVQAGLDELAGNAASPDDTEGMIARLMMEISCPQQRKQQYEQRLRWGLRQYYQRHYRLAGIDPTEE